MNNQRGLSIIEVLVGAAAVLFVSIGGTNFYVSTVQQENANEQRLIRDKIANNINAMAGVGDSLIVSESFASGPNLDLKKCLTPSVGTLGDCINGNQYPFYFYGAFSRPKSSSSLRILSTPLFGPESDPSYYDLNGEPCATPSFNCSYQVSGFFVPQCGLNSNLGSPYATCDIPEVIKINFKISRLSFANDGTVKGSAVIGNINNASLVLFDVSTVTGNKPAASPTVVAPDPTKVVYKQRRSDIDEYQYNSGIARTCSDDSDYSKSSRYDYRYDRNGKDEDTSETITLKHPKSKMTCPNNMFQNRDGDCDCGMGEAYDSTLIQCS